jgi:Tol biopolymer transport system component
MESGTTTLLYVKQVEDLTAKPVSGTQGARSPTFSPDGRWIAFFDEDERKLKKVSLSGGEPVTIAEADTQWGAVWAEDNTIFFSSVYGDLYRVAADGGTPEPVPVAGGGLHLWPTLLPGGEVLLFTLMETWGSFDDASIAAVPVGGGTPTIVFESAYYPHYAPSGHLIFVQQDSILAASFSPASLEFSGAPVKVIEGAWTSSWTGYADFAFSQTGTLIYLTGGPDPNQAKIVSVDRSGEIRTLVDARRPYRAPRVSPDGEQVVLTIADEQVDIWSYDLTRGSFHRLTDSASWDAYALWQPGTDWLTFSSMRQGVASIYRKNLRTGEVENLVTDDHPTYPSSWSPAGEYLAYTQNHPKTGNDIWLYFPEDDAKEVFLRTPFNESAAEFSPDGRFLAYHSNEGGNQLEVYVRPFPEVNPRWRISTDGGRTARWGPDGRELFYIVGGKLFAVEINTEPEFTAGPPRLLFEGPFGAGYDVVPGSPSFLMLREMDEGDPPLRINFVANWLDELSRRVPSR